MRRTEVGEGVLQRVQPAVGARPSTVVMLWPPHSTRQDQAGQDRLVVEEHGAGAAFAEFASVFGAGEVQIFAQDFEQRLVRRERDLDWLAVDDQRD